MADQDHTDPPSPPPDPASAPPDAPARRRPSRRAVMLVGLPLAALVVVSNVGDALAPTLVDTHPAWLIALNARNRNLVLVSNYLDAWTFYGIGIVRLLISDPLFFLLGYWYGDAAVKWMERRTRTWGQILRQFEGWFGKAAYPIIFIAPNNVFCLFAGASGMPVRAFVALNVSGTLFRLWLVRRFGEAFESPIDDLVGWIGDNRAILLVISVGLVILSVALEARGGQTEVSALTHLDDDLGDEAATGAATGDPTGDGESGDEGQGGRESGGPTGPGGPAAATGPSDPSPREASERPAD
jgi:membrane protein DedA with SNARE-associated domain